MKKRALDIIFQFHGGLVGFNFREDIAGFDRVANFFVPSDDNPFGHRITHFGHSDYFGHQQGVLDFGKRLGLSKRKINSIT